MQETKTHVANLVVAETEEDDRPFNFTGEHCMADFLEWLDTLTENDTRDVTVIAHNFQGYDGYFVIDEYHRQNRIVEQVRNGGKIMQLNFDRIRFIDSLSFFQMPLSAFPKTFGLTELKKGHFPHLFNRPENQDYIGPIPALHYYMPEVMSVSGRKAFETWHAQQTGTFNFAEELMAYCESDVKLLKEGCLKFKQLFEEKSKFNPFSCMTIASACNRDLRQNRMEPNTIASEPLHGWRLNTISLPCLTRMVILGRFKATQDSACEKPGGIQSSQLELHGGRVRRRHKYCLRISRMLFSWVSQMLPKQK